MRDYKLIAEIGWNHMGDLDLAEKMIVNAKKSAATHAKFQNWNVSNLKKGPWDLDGRREIYEKAELSKEKTLKLFNICKKNNINFLTSIFNINDAEFLSSIENSIIKLPSPEMRNEDLLIECSKKFHSIILSTGASNIEEVKKSLDLIKMTNKNCEVIVLHCVSIYPCPDDKVRINRIRSLLNIHNDVGISDHTTDSLSSILSLSLNISTIEKHFTIDNNLPGRDNKFALLPNEFIKIGQAIERYKLMSAELNFDNFLKEERETREIYAGRWSSN